MSLCFAQETGTLIVRYQTGPKEERLDRVRFRLWNDDQEEQFYPKMCSHCESDGCQHRMVVVENLQVGNYKLQFLVPNADHLFEEIPERSFEIHQGEVVKINQFIRPRYTAVKNVVTTKISTFLPLLALGQAPRPPFMPVKELKANLKNEKPDAYSLLNSISRKRSVARDPFNDLISISIRFFK